MAYEAVVWRSRLRPWLARAGRRVWPFWRDAPGFDSALSLGWAAAWVAFGRFEAFAFLPFVFVMLYGPTGILLATAYRLRRGGRVRRGWGVSFLVLFALTFGLHFVAAPPKRFKFLGNAPVVMRPEPTFPTYTEAVYTFEADAARLFAQVRAELSGKGYRVEERRGRLTADRSFRVEYPGSVWDVPDSVTLEPGRATGKRFVVDGDMTDLRPDPGWVTVTVDQPERLPFWLRLFVP